MQSYTMQATNAETNTLSVRVRADNTKSNAATSHRPVHSDNASPEPAPAKRAAAKRFEPRDEPRPSGAVRKPENADVRARINRPRAHRQRANRR